MERIITIIVLANAFIFSINTQEQSLYKNLCNEQENNGLDSLIVENYTTTFFNNIDSVIIENHLFGYIFLSKKTSYVVNINWRENIKSKNNVNNLELYCLINGIDDFFLKRRPIIKQIVNRDYCITADYFTFLDVRIYKNGEIISKFDDFIGSERDDRYYVYDDKFMEWFELVWNLIYEK